MRIRISRILACGAVLGLGFSAVSCAGGGANGPSDVVLIGFNLPNIAGVPLNYPLIYTFSDNVDPLTVTPDTIQVVGSPSFTFETIVVDGNLVAELPFIPNFEDYSDSGLAPGKTYNVFLPTFPAVDTVRSTRGRPLVTAESFTFNTNPVATFVEPRRPLIHSPGPISQPNPPPGAKGDDDGCVQNPTNSHFNGTFQTGTSADALLLCLKNEGPPHVLLDECFPTQNQRAIGSPSAVAPGFLDLPAVRIRLNEPLDPVTVVPYVPTTQRSLNVQLWRVGDTDANAIVPVQVKTNKPLIVQDLQQTETILVAVGPQPQGTYLINVQGVKDLPGNLLDLSDRPSAAEIAAGGYAPIDNGLTGIVPPGYRIYFRTLHVPPTTSAISEAFDNSFNERTDQLFTRSSGTTLPAQPIPGAPPATLTQAEPGQSTTANWNASYHPFGIASLQANSVLDDGAGRLKAVFEPYLGNGDDGDFDLPAGSATLNSDGSGDLNGDGIFEFNTFNVSAGATLIVHGPKPLMIMVRGACTVAGTIKLDGLRGGFGIDTDGSAPYTNSSAIRAGGVAAVSDNGGGGAGGVGAINTIGSAGDGSPGTSVYGEQTLASPGHFGFINDAAFRGGGGGGYALVGTTGSGGASTDGVGGAIQSSSDFNRPISSFVPERCFQPNADIRGGSGGGGGGGDDDNGASETGDSSVLINITGQATGGDDGGGGGGSGGGALWIMAKSITVSGTISAKGGPGGNTYGPGAQVTTDPNPMNSGDEFISGVTDPTAAGTGQGGGGGGGAGGAVLLQARDSVSVAGTIDVSGGAGGTTAGGTRNGGAGSEGRIGIVTMVATSDFVTPGTISVTGTITPVAGLQGILWKPTIDLTSQGVPKWVDLLGSTATFQAPFWDSNFGLLTGAGLAQGAGLDFNAILELQGADTLLPNASLPTGATGLTAWVPSASFATLNSKQFVRWRWRFFVNREASGGPAPFFDQNIHAMPAILEFTLPFTK